MCQWHSLSILSMHFIAHVTLCTMHCAPQTLRNSVGWPLLAVAMQAASWAAAAGGIAPCSGTVLVRCAWARGSELEDPEGGRSRAPWSPATAPGSQPRPGQAGHSDGVQARAARCSATPQFVSKPAFCLSMTRLDSCGSTQDAARQPSQTPDRQTGTNAGPSELCQNTALPEEHAQAPGCSSCVFRLDACNEAMLSADRAARRHAELIRRRWESAPFREARLLAGEPPYSHISVVD
jgi:hypothetical protein